MSCKPLKGVLRGESRLVGKLASSRVLGPSGVYIDGSFQGKANGYYVDNSPALIPDGCYRNGWLVDPYYERIRDAALAEGGGLYLFQLEYGQYAGEQVIWQEMGELTPWVPGLLTPQGKTYDLMDSGEYLGQSVSMRRPVDGVWDGVGTWMDASSMAVGGHLHQSKPSGWFAGIESISSVNNAAIIATGRASSTEDGIEVRNNNAGIAQYFRSGSTPRGSLAAASLGISPGLGEHVVGVSRSDTRRKVIADGSVELDAAAPAHYPDAPADHVLRVGAATYGGQLINARYTYIAIYTREPTPYEISLHKRTP